MEHVAQKEWIYIHNLLRLYFESNYQLLILYNLCYMHLQNYQTLILEKCSCIKYVQNKTKCIILKSYKMSWKICNLEKRLFKEGFGGTYFWISANKNSLGYIQRLQKIYVFFLNSFSNSYRQLFKCRVYTLNWITQTY